MTVKIALNPNQIQNLDLSSLETIIQDYQSRAAIAKLEQACWSDCWEAGWELSLLLLVPEQGCWVAVPQQAC